MIPISEQRPWSAATMLCSERTSLGLPHESLLIAMLLLSAPAAHSKYLHTWSAVCHRGGLRPDVLHSKDEDLLVLARTQSLREVHLLARRRRRTGEMMDWPAGRMSSWAICQSHTSPPCRGSQIPGLTVQDLQKDRCSSLYRKLGRGSHVPRWHRCNSILLNYSCWGGYSRLTYLKQGNCRWDVGIAPGSQNNCISSCKH